MPVRAGRTNIIAAPLPPQFEECKFSSDELRAMPGYAVATTARKPLLAAEAGAVKQTVMVTGATGFIGSRLVERLLAVGHVVHVLVRPRPAGIAAADDMLAYLQRLPGAEQRLTVVCGDVSDSASLLLAMQGCSQLVHLAAVVDLLTPKDEAQRQAMVDTALRGTRLVLDAATVTGTITKVVLVSSIVAVMWDWHERGADHVYTEADWTADNSVQLSTYAFCKRESERLALYMAQQQHIWELAVINPGVVFGPVACPKLAQSLSISLPIVKNLNGDRYPYTSNIYISHVDVDDVAAATCGLLATPGATGRHLLVSGAVSMTQLVRLLAAAFPHAKVPYKVAPGWAVALLARINSKQLGFDIHKFRAVHNKPFKVDCSKIAAVLPGFAFIPVDESARAAAACIVAMGLAAAKPAACCTAPRVREHDEGSVVAAEIVLHGSVGGVPKQPQMHPAEGAGRAVLQA